MSRFNEYEKKTWASRKVVGNRIKIIKHKMGLTTDKFNKKFFICPGTYGRWSRGVHYPNIDAVHVMADTLGITVEDILSPKSRLDDPNFMLDNHPFRIITWPDLETVSIRLQQLLKDKGIDKFVLANDLGISPQTIQFWLRGKHYPNEDSTRKLAEYFGLDEQTLIYGNNQ